MRHSVCLVTLLLGVALGSIAEAEETSALDKIFAFFSKNVVDRKIVTTQWNPQKTDEESGKPYKTTWTRTSCYSNARKTDYGMSVDYRVVVSFKTYYLDDKEKPTGAPFNLRSYDTDFQLALMAYSGHKALHGISRAVKVKKDGKQYPVPPYEYRRAVVYLTDDGSVLRLQERHIVPEMAETGPSEQMQPRRTHIYEKIWMEKGRLHRRQIHENYHVDPQTLENGRPMDSEEKGYYDFEKPNEERYTPGVGI